MSLMERDQAGRIICMGGLAISLLGCVAGPTEGQYLTGTIHEIAVQNNGVISEIPFADGTCYLYTFGLPGIPQMMDERVETDTRLFKNFDLMNRSLLRLGKRLDERYLLFHKSPVVTDTQVQVVSKQMPLNWYRRDLHIDPQIDDMRYVAVTTGIDGSGCSDTTGITEAVVQRLYSDERFQSLLRKNISDFRLLAVPTSTPEAANFIHAYDTSLTPEEQNFIESGGLLIGEIAMGIVMPEEWYIAANTEKDYCYVFDATQKNKRSIVNHLRSVIDHQGVTHTCKYNKTSRTYQWVPESSLLKGRY